MNLRDTGIQSLPFPTSATPQTTLSQTVELQEAGFVFNGTKNKIFLCCVAPSPRDPGSVSLRHRPDPRARTEPRGSPAGRERPPARRGLARRSPAPPLGSQPRGGGRREGRGEAPIPGLPAAERCQGAGPRLRAPPHRSPAWACRCRSPSSARPAGTLASDKPLTPLPPSSRLPQGAGLRRRAGCSGARDGPRRHLVASSVRARRAEVGALPWFCVQ